MRLEELPEAVFRSPRRFWEGVVRCVGQDAGEFGVQLQREFGSRVATELLMHLFVLDNVPLLADTRETAYKRSPGGR